MSSAHNKKMAFLLLALCTLSIVFAATYTDTLDADFQAGNTTQVNSSLDSIFLQNASSSAYNTSGTFYSQVFDLGSNPNASISWTYATPTGTSVLVATRSGNNSVAGSTGWSSWSSDYATSSGSTVTSVTNRYYQYRVQLVTTDNTTTPTVTDVTLTYTESNTSFNRASSWTNLTGATSGTYIYYANVSDTFTVLSVTGRYSINGNSFSSSSSLTSVSGTTYSLNISEPSGGWDNATNATSNGTLTIELTAIVNDGSSNFTRATNMSETIEFVNTDPVIDPISNEVVAQGVEMNVTVTASDVDSQAITFTTNNSAITVTAISNTSAYLTWTPNATNVGLHTVIVYANDTIGQDSTSFIVNVTDVNDAPEIEDVDDFEGYHGVRQVLVLTATDLDSGANLSFSVDPAYFTFTTTTTLNGSAAPSGTYYGIANFSPADLEDGVTNLTFIVTDGTDSANTSATYTVGYCGDLTCDEDYENESICAVDCVEVLDLDIVALVVPDRNCAGEEMTIYAYNATDRFSCSYLGLTEAGKSLCAPLDGASITVYLRTGALLTEKGSLSTNSDGAASFTPAVAGEYKFSAVADDFANSSAIVQVRDCSADITVVNQNTTVTQPELPPLEEDDLIEPREEEPTTTKEEASLISIIIFYFIIPTLLAMLAYTSFVFYDVNKDTLPVLLEIRIFLYEQRVKYQPQVLKVWRVLQPYLTPVAQSLKTIYVAALKPTVDQVINLFKRK